MKSSMVFSNEYKIFTTDFQKDKNLSEDILTYLIKESYCNKLVSDIGDVDFNKDVTNKTSLKEISNLFCDNIILYGLIKQDNIYYNLGTLYTLDIFMRIKDNATRKAVKTIILTFRLASSNHYQLKNGRRHKPKLTILLQ